MTNTLKPDDGYYDDVGFSEYADYDDNAELEDFKARFKDFIENFDEGERFSLDDIIDSLEPSQESEYEWINRRIAALLRTSPPVLSKENTYFVKRPQGILLAKGQYDLIRWAYWFHQPFTLKQAAAMLDKHVGTVQRTIKAINELVDGKKFIIESPGNNKNRFDNSTLFYWELSSDTYGVKIDSYRVMILPKKGFIQPQKEMCKTCIGRSPSEGGLEIPEERYREISESTLSGTQHLCHSSDHLACRAMSDLLNRWLFINGFIKKPGDTETRAFTEAMLISEPFVMNRKR